MNATDMLVYTALPQRVGSTFSFVLSSALFHPIVSGSGVKYVSACAGNLMKILISHNSH